VEVERQAAEQIEPATDPCDQNRVTVRELTGNGEIESGHGMLRSNDGGDADTRLSCRAGDLKNAGWRFSVAVAYFPVNPFFREDGTYLCGIGRK
jgi:hypothetical protein